MSLIDKVMGMFGKQRGVDANVAENRARQQTLHGQGLSQTDSETSGTRQSMEAELERQREQRTPPPAG
jgi:hypothetical protein